MKTKLTKKAQHTDLLQDVLLTDQFLTLPVRFPVIFHLHEVAVAGLARVNAQQETDDLRDQLGHSPGNEPSEQIYRASSKKADK